MGDGVEARMNVAAVRRVDPYASDIVDTSAHVALYSFGETEWIKTDIEGALFLYSRRGPPAHSILVMNRLSTENLIEPVTRGLELQIQEPFLLYRNSHRKIYGLWFYDRDECARVAAKIDSLVKAEPTQPERNPPPPGETRPVDIFSMLSKAQNDYNENNRPRPPDVASQSVVDFFMKAGGGGPPPGPPPAFAAAAPAEDKSMTLQRLMSDPVRSVEHIEKQQRSTTPRDDKNAKKNGPGNGKQSRKPAPPAKGAQERRPPEPEAAPPRPRPPDARETPPKPALMPPTMFTPSAARAPPPPAAEAPPAPRLELRPEPLTRNQLLQALNHLMKNDADFVTKLHEAYVKSFSELVS